MLLVFRFVLQFGICNPGVVYAGQHIDECGFGRGDVLEREIRIAETSFLELVVDDVVHQLGDVLFRLFRQCSGGGFDGVRHHHHRAFPGYRVGTVVGEQGFIDFSVWVLVFERVVEIPHFAFPVVGADEVHDVLRQVVFLCQFDALVDVVDDALCAFVEIAFVVRIHPAALVFDEENRVVGFADVVVEGSRPDQQGIAPDAVDGFLRQVGNHQGVLKGAGCFLRQAPQCRMVGIGELKQGDVRSVAEYLFKDIDDRVGQGQQQAVDEQPEEHQQVGRPDFAFLAQDKGDVNQRIGGEHQQDGQYQLSSALQVVEAEYGNDARRYLHEGEHVAVRGVAGNQQAGVEQQIQGGSAVNQDVDDDDEEKNRNGVQADVLVVAYAAEGYRCQEQSVQEDEFPVAVKHLFLGIVEKGGKYRQGDERQQELPADGAHVCFRASQVALVLVSERVQQFYFFGGDQFPFADDDVALLYHTLGQTDVFQVVHLILGGLGEVELQVGQEVVVQVQAEYLFAHGFRESGLVDFLNEGGIRRFQGIDVAELDCLGDFVFNHLDALDVQGIPAFRQLQQSRLVYLFQPSDNPGQCRLRGRRFKGVQGGLELFRLENGYLVVAVEDGGILFRNLFAFFLQFLVCFVNGEVERRSQGLVTPRHAFLVFVLEVADFGKQVDNDDADEEYDS